MRPWNSPNKKHFRKCLHFAEAIDIMRMCWGATPDTRPFVGTCPAYEGLFYCTAAFAASKLAAFFLPDAMPDRYAQMRGRSFATFGRLASRSSFCLRGAPCLLRSSCRRSPWRSRPCCSSCCGRMRESRRRRTANRIRMLGPILALQQCQQCHLAERGEMLCAFSYEFLRDAPPAFEAQADGPAPAEL